MFQNILDTIPQFVCWKDKNSVFLGCNSNYAKMTGLPNAQSIIGKTDWDLPWKKEETEKFIKNGKIMMQSDTAEYHIIESATDSDGNISYLDTSKAPIHDADGNVTGILVAFEDITDWINSQRVINEYTERLKLTTQAANIAWWEIDISTGSVIFDSNKMEMLGYSSDEFTHYTDFTKLIHSDDYGTAMNAMKSHIDGLSDKYETVYRILAQSGEYR